MTRGSVQEYVEALRQRYRRASRQEKGRILNEFTQVTGYHRKAAIRTRSGRRTFECCLQSPTICKRF